MQHIDEPVYAHRGNPFTTSRRSDAHDSRRNQGNNLARETNFVELYRLLDLKPGCELGEFKQAYRRRVAALHPDRRTRADNDEVASERLQHLTALYSSAIDFERRHGRLPGALHTRPPGGVATGAPVNGNVPRAPAVPPSGTLRRLWVGGALAIIAIWLVWSPPWQTDGVDTDASVRAPLTGTADEHVENDDVGAASMIRVGSSTEAVRALEGEPVLINGNRWEYGPSWVYFQADGVVDWYSSPLHPLETASVHPQKNDK